LAFFLEPSPLAQILIKMIELLETFAYVLRGEFSTTVLFFLEILSIYSSFFMINETKGLIVFLSSQLKNQLDHHYPFGEVAYFHI